MKTENRGKGVAPQPFSRGSSLIAAPPSTSCASETGIAYTPLSQRPRSISAQRREQKGVKGLPDGLPQIGHGLLIAPSFLITIT